MKISTDKKSMGFTIVELLMATAVFSLVLLLAITGFIQVGKTFYKAIEIGKTQDSAGNILDSVSADLHSLTPLEAPVTKLLASDVTQGYTCIGVHRYSFFLSQNTSGNLVDIGTPVSPSTAVGLIRDTLPAKNDCRPLSGSNALPLSSNSQQMLGDGMSLGKFYIYQPDPVNSRNLWGVKITVGFGDNTNPGGVFDESGTDSDASVTNYGVATNTLHCNGALGTNFCAVTNLNTFATKGLGLQ